MRYDMLWTAVAVAVILGGSGAARADFIVNGGFETGNFSYWTHTSDGGDAVSPSSLAVHSGQFGAVLQPRGGANGLSQVVTGLIPGNLYTVSFWLSNLSNTGSGSFSAIVSSGGHPLVSVAIPRSTPAFPYTEFSHDFVATSPTATVSLSYQTAPGQWLLDDVSLTAAPSTSVMPAPPSAVGLLSGLVAMGIVQRRRRRGSSR